MFIIVTQPSLFCRKKELLKVNETQNSSLNLTIKSRLQNSDIEL